MQDEIDDHYEDYEEDEVDEQDEVEPEIPIVYSPVVKSLPPLIAPVRQQQDSSSMFQPLVEGPVIDPQSGSMKEFG